MALKNGSRQPPTLNSLWFCSGTGGQIWARSGPWTTAGFWHIWCPELSPATFSLLNETNVPVWFWPVTGDHVFQIQDFLPTWVVLSAGIILVVEVCPQPRKLFLPLVPPQAQRRSTFYTWDVKWECPESDTRTLWQDRHGGQSAALTELVTFQSGRSFFGGTVSGDGVDFNGSEGTHCRGTDNI